jgi:hypothetical protein
VLRVLGCIDITHHAFLAAGWCRKRLDGIHARVEGVAAVGHSVGAARWAMGMGMGMEMDGGMEMEMDGGWWMVEWDGGMGWRWMVEWRWMVKWDGDGDGDGWWNGMEMEMEMEMDGGMGWWDGIDGWMGVDEMG